MRTPLRLIRRLALAGILFVLAFPGSAAAMTENTTVGFTMMITNPCTFEDVLVTGTMHMLVIASDNKGEFTVNWPNTSGVALGTQTKYQANDSSHLYVMSAPDGGFTVAFQDSFELVSQSPTPNFVIHMALGFRFNPKTGSLAEIDRSSGSECSGSGP